MTFDLFGIASPSSSTSKTSSSSDLSVLLLILLSIKLFETDGVESGLTLFCFTFSVISVQCQILRKNIQFGSKIKMKNLFLSSNSTQNSVFSLIFWSQYLISCQNGHVPFYMKQVQEPQYNFDHLISIFIFLSRDHNATMSTK